MALSEIRVNTTKTRTGVGTITYTETGPVITGIATASNFKTGSTNVHSTGVELANINTGGSTATFGGPISGTTATLSGALSGTTATLSGALSGTTASFTGNVSIGGTLTYEDVTNIDSVGIITARDGLKVLAGGANVVGMSTFTGAALNVVSTGGAYNTHLNYANNGTNYITSGNGNGTYFRGSSNNVTSMVVLGSGQVDIESSIRHIGDTDTLMEFGTDTITFDTAGSERLRITSGGDILLGTDHATIGANTADGSDNRVWSLCGGSDASQSRGAVITLYGNEAPINSNYGTLSLKSGNTTTGFIDFWTQGAKRLEIASDGQIKKVQDPVNRTSLKTYSGEGLWFDHYQLQSSGTYQRYADIVSVGDGSWGSNMRFFTMPNSGSAIERLRITSTGEVCIGRTSSISDAKLAIQCVATKPAIAIQCNHTNTDTDLITAFNSGGKNIINITAETDNSPYLKFEILSGNTAIERFRVNHLGNVAIGGGTAPNRLEIINDHKGFPSDSAQPNATLLIKHGTSGSDRRWVGIGASTTGAWMQSSSPGGSGLSAPLWINKGGGDVTLGNDKFKVASGGLIGANTTSPYAGIHVKSHSNGWQGGILLEDTDSSGNRSGWNIHPDNNNSLMFGRNTNFASNTVSHVMSITDDRTIDTASRTITGGNNLVIQAFRVKRIYSGSPSIGKACELISGYDGNVKMAAIGYNLTDTTNHGGTYGGDLTFHTQPLYSSPSTPLPTRMRIASDGDISMPSKPAFRSYLTTERTTNGDFSSGWSTNEQSFFNWDTNNDFDPSTGKFTAPSDGKYHFICQWDASSVLSMIDMKINSTFAFRYEPTGNTAAWESHGWSCLVWMSKGDFAILNGRGASGSYPFHMGGGYWGYWCGFKVN